MRRHLRRPLSVAAATLLAATVLAACGSDDTNDAGDTAGAPTPAVTESPTDGPATGEPDETDAAGSETPDKADGRHLVEVTLSGTKVEPPPHTVRVDKGTKMRFLVTSDAPTEIHVHGYDVHGHVDEPGETATLDFVADTQGSFEVESHDPDVLLFQLQVR